MTSIFLAFLSLLMPGAEVAQASDRQLCKPEMLLHHHPGSSKTEDCQDYSQAPLDLRKHRDEADGVLFNYALVGKREHRSKIESFGRNASEQDAKRALALAEQARRHAIDYVTGKRPQETWSNETRAIVERIQALKFRISELSDGDCYDHGDIGYPQAAYSRFDHAIGICASLAKTHSEGIFATIAHEIGHAVSSCNMKRPLVRYREITTEDSSCLLGYNSHSSLSDDEISQESNVLVRTYREIQLGLDLDSANTERYVKCGVAERVKDSALTNGVSAFLSFDSCANRKFQRDYRNYVAKRVFYWDELPQKLSRELQAIADKFMSENPQSCYRKSEEHFADSFSAQVVAARHSTASPDRSTQILKKTYRESVFDLTSIFCVEKLEGRNLSNRLLYPLDRERVLSYFAPKSIQDLFNCQLKPGEVCELPTDPASYPSSSTSRPFPSKKTGTTR